ncbi:MAG TPA: hypothetical protein VGH28_01225 [Polyangiaceae bacterium]|jgi:hypothetical protein
MIAGRTIIVAAALAIVACSSTGPAGDAGTDATTDACTVASPCCPDYAPTARVDCPSGAGAATCSVPAGLLPGVSTVPAGCTGTYRCAQCTCQPGTDGGAPTLICPE